MGRHPAGLFCAEEPQPGVCVCALCVISECNAQRNGRTICFVLIHVLALLFCYCCLSLVLVLLRSALVLVQLQLLTQGCLWQTDCKDKWRNIKKKLGLVE